MSTKKTTMIMMTFQKTTMKRMTSLLPDGVVLQLADGPEAGHHVLHGGLEPDVGVPRPHALVEAPHVLGELLALHVHVLHVNLHPGGRLPFVNRGPGRNIL